MRIDPGLHRDLAVAAEKNDKSLNSFVVDACRHHLKDINNHSQLRDFVARDETLKPEVDPTVKTVFLSENETDKADSYIVEKKGR